MSFIKRHKTVISQNWRHQVWIQSQHPAGVKCIGPTLHNSTECFKSAPGPGNISQSRQIFFVSISTTLNTRHSVNVLSRTLWHYWLYYDMTQCFVENTLALLTIIWHDTVFCQEHSDTTDYDVTWHSVLSRTLWHYWQSYDMTQCFVKNTLALLTII